MIFCCVILQIQDCIWTAGSACREWWTSGPGDGDCMLRAVSRRLFSTEEHHLLIRLLTSLELIQHPKFYDTSHPDYKDKVCDVRVYNHDPYHSLVLSATKIGDSSEFKLVHTGSAASKPKISIWLVGVPFVQPDQEVTITLSATVGIVLNYRILFVADVHSAGLPKFANLTKTGNHARQAKRPKDIDFDIANMHFPEDFYWAASICHITVTVCRYEVSHCFIV